MVFNIKALATSLGFMTPSYYLYNQYYEDKQLSMAHNNVVEENNHLIELVCIVPFIYFLINIYHRSLLECFFI